MQTIRSRGPVLLLSTCKRLLWGLFLLALTISGVNAFSWFFPVSFKHGEVIARGIVKGPNGMPIFVIYSEDGSVAGEIGEATGELADAFVISRATYQAYVDQMNGYLGQSQPQYRGARVMTKDDYNATTFKTLDGKYDLNKPSLAPDTVSVVVRGNQTLLQREDDPLLMQAPINLFNAGPMGANIKSMLFNRLGELVQSSSLNIGFKAEFYEYPTLRLKPIGPIPYVFVEGPNAALGGISGDMTNDKGQFSFPVIYPPCPGFVFMYNSNVSARLYFRNFNPRGNRLGIYYIMKPDYDICFGLSAYAPGLTLGGLMAQIDVMAIEAATSIPFFKTKFLVDVMMLTGEARVAHGTQPVQVAGATQYKYEQPDTSPINYQEGADALGNATTGYDFDGDGKPDRAIRGQMQINEQTKKEEFVPNAEGTLQGIYLSSGDRRPDAQNPAKRQPDFTRLMDKKSDFSHQGLLSSISMDDLKDTDMYVFRESNGMLITERKGLKADEALFNTGGINEKSNKIYYRMLIRGPREGNMLRTDFSGWQAKSKMNPALIPREADHLRPGENVRIILINRATGYIGSVTTQLKAANQTAGQTISFPISDIYLNPPNLSVRAVRRLKIEQGFTNGEDRDYLIGFEGGASSHDNVIEVFTEWYDQDGRPLPEELGEYGYTGRLAKIIGANQLAPEGGDLANFSIKPGKQRQLIRIKDNAITKEHYYIHINGNPSNRNADFSTLGAGQGPLQFRPKHYVPFKVPVFDERATIEARAVWKKAKEEGQVTGRFPLPVYRFVYRPEMQFSLFDLQIKEMMLRDEQNATAQDVLRRSDNDLSLGNVLSVGLAAYAQAQDTLPLLGASRELVFNLAGAEMIVTIGKDNQLHFSDLNFINRIKAEEFLMASLYLNNDPENLLWEFAFGGLDLDGDSDNNNNGGMPDENRAEEKIEEPLPGDPAKPGVRIDLKVVDTDQDKIPDYADFESSNGLPPASKFNPLVLKLNLPEKELERKSVRFIYDASDPSKIYKYPEKQPKYVEEDDPILYVPADKGLLRIWLVDGDKNRKTFNVQSDGDFIPSLQTIPLKKMRLTKAGSSQKVTLYVEALGISRKAADARIRIEVVE